MDYWTLRQVLEDKLEDELSIDLRWIISSSGALVTSTHYALFLQNLYSECTTVFLCPKSYVTSEPNLLSIDIQK